MEYDFKREARKQYLHYFRFWFIAVAVLAVICIVLGAMKFLESRRGRTNHEAPAERVYDYADVLTDSEEEQLRRYIAEKEEKLHIDIVLVTISKSVEGAAAKEEYSYRSAEWEDNMQDIADDFWDENKYGYNKSFNGDGILLLHNWYEGQNGEILSTSGKVEEAFSLHDLDTVLYAVDNYYETDTCKAYLAYIDTVERLLERGAGEQPFVGGLGIIISLIVALIYAAAHLVQKPAQNTTAVNAYVQGGKPDMRRKSDDFTRKTVSSRRIQTSSSGGSRSGGGSSGRSGGGGHHVSRSGASHGGASHRH